MRNRGCSPCHGSARAISPFSATKSLTTVRCAAEKKITGNEEAYFKALYRGLKDALSEEIYSMVHCMKRTKYGILDDELGLVYKTL